MLEYETSKVISTPVIKELPRAEVGKELYLIQIADAFEKGFNCSSPYHVNRDLSYTKRESSLS